MAAPNEFELGDRVTIRGHVEGLSLAGRLARISKGGFILAGRRYYTIELDEPATSSDPSGGSSELRVLPIPADALALWEPLAVIARRKMEQARAAAPLKERQQPTPEALATDDLDNEPAPPAAADCVCGHSASAHGPLSMAACGFCFCGEFRPQAGHAALKPDGGKQVEPGLDPQVQAALTALASNPAFRNVTPEDLLAIGRRGRRRRILQGSELVRAGERADRVFLLLDGAAELKRPRGGNGFSAQLHMGEIVGAVGLLHGGSYTATVTALDDQQVLELGSKEVQELLEEHPALRPAFRSILRRRAALQ